MKNEELSTLVRSARAKGYSFKQIGDAVGASQSSVHGWAKGGTASHEHYIELIKFLGGDINRALPSFSQQDKEEISFIGEISELYVDVSEEVAEAIRGISQIMNMSKYSKYSEGDIKVARVSTDAMSPVIPDYSFIGVARPNRFTFRERVPAVLTYNGEKMIRMISESRNDRNVTTVNLLPINLKSYDIITCKPKDFEINFIVLGVINPWMMGIG